MKKKNTLGIANTYSTLGYKLFYFVFFFQVFCQTISAQIPISQDSNVIFILAKDAKVVNSTQIKVVQSQSNLSVNHIVLKGGALLYNDAAITVSTVPQKAKIVKNKTVVICGNVPKLGITKQVSLPKEIAQKIFITHSLTESSVVRNYKLQDSKFIVVENNPQLKFIKNSIYFQFFNFEYNIQIVYNWLSHLFSNYKFTQSLGRAPPISFI